MKKSYLIVLTFVFLLGTLLSFYRLTKTPPCLNWDETSFAYNAYSILKTGKDEYGVSFPVQFKSVGDYKFPLFIYSLVPIIKVFGLTEFSVRLLPALLGSISILLIFFLSLELFKSPIAALFSAFFFAVSPWHLQFSRAGADVGVSSFFVILGILGFARAINQKKFGFILSFISFTAALYTYYGERVFIPLFLTLCLFYFRTEIKKRLKTFLRAGLITLALLIPMFHSAVSSGQQEKFLKTTIFGYTRSEDYLNQLISEDKSYLVTQVFHSAPLEYSLAVVDHYLNHFSPNFLFTQGPTLDKRQFIFDMGMMYLLEIPLLLMGVFLLLKKKSKLAIFVLLWLLIAPIPAAITRDPVHARRALNMVPPLMLILGVGGGWCWEKINAIKKRRVRVVTVGLSGLVILFFLSFYLLSYYVFTPERTYKGAGGWQCGYKELVNYLSPIKDNYKNIIIDTSYQGPYIFFLFYEKYPPELYQPQARLVQESPDMLGEGAGYDNYAFRPIYWPDDRWLRNTLFVGPPERLPEKDFAEVGAKIIKKIFFANGEIAFLIVSTF